MNENEWDKLLKIHTTGTDNTDADQYRYPYEPTPYSVLERLGNSGWIQKENTLLDYGCGKGRVDFFCPIRHAVILSALNIMNGFMQRQ